MIYDADKSSDSIALLDEATSKLKLVLAEWSKVRWSGFHTQSSKLCNRLGSGCSSNDSGRASGSDHTRVSHNSSNLWEDRLTLMQQHGIWFKVSTRLCLSSWSQRAIALILTCLRVWFTNLCEHRGFPGLIPANATLILWAEQISLLNTTANNTLVRWNLRLSTHDSVHLKSWNPLTRANSTSENSA